MVNNTMIFSTIHAVNGLPLPACLYTEQVVVVVVVVVVVAVAVAVVDLHSVLRNASNALCVPLCREQVSL